MARHAVDLDDWLNVLLEGYFLGEPLVDTELHSIRPLGTLLDPLFQDFLLIFEQGIFLIFMLDRRHDLVVVGRQGRRPVEGAFLRITGRENVLGLEGERFLVEAQLAFGLVLSVAGHAVEFQYGFHVAKKVDFSHQRVA